LPSFHVCSLPLHDALPILQATSQLTHPNTIAIYDFGRAANGVFYYAMESLEGINLAALVGSDGAQPQGRVLFILRQMNRTRPWRSEEHTSELQSLTNLPSP